MHWIFKTFHILYTYISTSSKTVTLRKKNHYVPSTNMADKNCTIEMSNLSPSVYCFVVRKTKLATKRTFCWKRRQGANRIFSRKIFGKKRGAVVFNRLRSKKRRNRTRAARRLLRLCRAKGLCLSTRAYAFWRRTSLCAARPMRTSRRVQLTRRPCHDHDDEAFYAKGFCDRHTPRRFYYVYMYVLGGCRVLPRNFIRTRVSSHRTRSLIRAPYSTERLAG